MKLLESFGYVGYDIGILFVGVRTMVQYNVQYRHKNCATDVLAFPCHFVRAGSRITSPDADEHNLGDIIISPPYVLSSEQWAGQPLARSLDELIIHGFCHLVGYDHTTPSKHRTMRAKERALLDLVGT